LRRRNAADLAAVAIEETCQEIDRTVLAHVVGETDAMRVDRLMNLIAKLRPILATVDTSSNPPPSRERFWA